MNGFYGCNYREKKERRWSRIIWCIINATLFRITPTNKLRIAWLKLFGADLRWNHVIYPSAKIFAPWNLSITTGSVIGPRVEIYNKAPVSRVLLFHKMRFCVRHRMMCPLQQWLLLRNQSLLRTMFGFAHEQLFFLV